MNKGQEPDEPEGVFIMNTWIHSSILLWGNIQKYIDAGFDVLGIYDSTLDPVIINKNTTEETLRRYSKICIVSYVSLFNTEMGVNYPLTVTPMTYDKCKVQNRGVMYNVISEYTAQRLWMIEKPNNKKRTNFIEKNKHRKIFLPYS